MGYVIDEGPKRKPDAVDNQQAARANKASGESYEYEPITRGTFTDHSEKEDRPDDGE